MTRIVLVHGWGFDAAVWSRVRDQLGSPARTRISTLDLGYFGPANDAAAVLTHKGPASESPLIAVGHSLGLLWLLKNDRLPDRARILGINGFTRFAKADDFPAGVPPRLLDRMSAGLLRNAEDVLAAFRDRCGVDAKDDASTMPSGTPDVASLREGLGLLRDGDARRTAERVACVLAARDDTLVTPAMMEGAFSRDRIQWTERGGHMLPLTRPDLCAAFILDAAKDVDHEG